MYLASYASFGIIMINAKFKVAKQNKGFNKKICFKITHELRFTR